MLVKYRVLAINNYGKSSSDGGLFVSPNLDDDGSKSAAQRGEKPSFVKKLDDLCVDESFPAKFEVKVQGSPEPEIKWYRNGQELQSKSGVLRISTNPDGTSKLVLHEATLNDQGVYKVIATNPLGTAECTGELTVSAPSADKKDYGDIAKAAEAAAAATSDSDEPGIMKHFQIAHCYKTKKKKHIYSCVCEIVQQQHWRRRQPFFGFLALNLYSIFFALSRAFKQINDRQEIYWYFCFLDKQL